MTPLRTIHIDGYPLRIYVSPLTVPDHPGASFHDLMTLAEMEEAISPDGWISCGRNCPTQSLLLAQNTFL